MASLLIIQEPKRTDLNKNFLDYIEMYRVAHLVNIIYKMFDFCLSSPTKFNKYMFSQKMFETISMFLYFLVAMYSIWGISKHDVDTKDIADHKMLQKERTWLFIEISSFLLQVFSGAFFLVQVQVKGILGWNLSPDSDRYKSDALGYYIQEVHWFNLIFVTGLIHAISISSNLEETTKTAEPLKFVYSGLMIASRVLQCYFLLPLKDT